MFFHGMIERSDLLLKLASFDIALVPLKTRIYGSVPSKIFEYSSLGIPVLYIGGGEGEKIVEENGLGWTVEVENFEGLNTALRQISMIDRLELTSMKKKIFEHSKTKFNLNLQIEKLIRNKVF
jgi:glycosyltransferase involved in cell wall biosynthesis